MIVWCQNEPCESEADYIVVEPFGWLPLCGTCAGAYKLGQESPMSRSEPVALFSDDDLKAGLGNTEWEENPTEVMGAIMAAIGNPLDEWVEGLAK